MESFVLDFHSVVDLTDDQFFRLCQKNRDLRIERTASGEIIVMPPTGGDSGHSNFRLSQQLANWTDDHDGLGLGFDSSMGFNLPNGASRSPDAAWVARTRWESLTPEQRQKFPPLCPDFVVELKSPTDRLRTLQAKMCEYIANGAALGWLINLEERTVEIYRPRKEVEILIKPTEVSADPLLPSFVLRLAPIWGA
ncbi:Uma2 family endonuclease [Gloeobacter morelensis]|uniref:Uma2 family endonuclease n=1 Tax=Gloeobacter morelensis MG652769 TaxID=2781736 RepID=A0ABY3PRI8_9CYAN|nr:Uma2 family endonuclease [Gloeobacter morelensis]UFP96207.1 Uma2 family endonuclease [Gloeobacter morelensis MG652769]